MSSWNPEDGSLNRLLVVIFLGWECSLKVLEWNSWVRILCGGDWDAFIAYHHGGLEVKDGVLVSYGVNDIEE